MWASIGNIGFGLINLLITFILARLLVPADFGLVELVIVITSISTVFVDSGFSQALIRDKQATLLDISSVFYVNVVIALLCYSLLFWSVPGIAVFFNEPRLTGLGRVCFLTLIFDALSIAQNANFTRQMLFKPIAISNLVGISVAGGVGVILAWLDFGVWALAGTMTLSSLFRTITLWLISPWHPVWGISWRSVKKYFSFGGFLLLHTLIDKIVLNFESFVIGRLYTKQQLGYFSQSGKINAYFCHALTNVIVKVTYPALVRLDDSEERLKEGYRKIIGLTTFVVTPLMIFLIFFPGMFIYTFLGEQWLDAAPLLMLWSVFGLFFPIQSICNNIFYVKGLSKQLFYLSVIRQILKIAVVLSFARISMFAILLGTTLVAVFATFLYVYFSGRLISYSFREVWQDICKNLVVSIVSASLTLLLLNFLILPGYSYGGFCFCCVSMGGMYLCLNRWLHNRNYIEVKEIFFSLLKKNQDK